MPLPESWELYSWLSGFFMLLDYRTAPGKPESRGPTYNGNSNPTMNPDRKPSLLIPGFFDL